MSTQPTMYRYTCNACQHVTRAYSTALLHEIVSHRASIRTITAAPNDLGGFNND